MIRLPLVHRYSHPPKKRMAIGSDFENVSAVLREEQETDSSTHELYCRAPVRWARAEAASCLAESPPCMA